ncbi:MAG: DUF2849 domain-containing protein [Nitratireductor sp.]|nr:DUF2849 domain-containing protein [Nitratireductor sp.]
MARAFTPKIVTANDLLVGDVIYLTRSGAWSRLHEEAHPATSEEQARTMLEHAQKQSDRIVGPYLADVEIGDDDRPHPVHFREVFRTRGPSNYPHGKQAQ